MKEELRLNLVKNDKITVRGRAPDRRIAGLLNLNEIRKQSARCAICESPFIPENRYARFCRTCKEQSDVYRFAEAV